MKYCLICYPGLEIVSQKEIKELANAKGIVEDSVVLFESKDIDCKKFKSAIRVLHLLDSFDFKSLDDFKRCEKTDFPVKGSFAVSCERHGTHKFNSHEVEELVGSFIDGKVNLKKPDTTFFVYIFNNKAYVGIDLTGDLSKREYRLFCNSQGVKGNIAYALVRIADFNEKDVLVDPFCKDGVIPIEAALYLSKAKVFGLDSLLRNIKASKSNSKIAKINIDFTNLDVGWLDTRFKEKEITKVVSVFPSASKAVSAKEIEKLADELFRQLRHVLSDKGIIVLLSKNNKPLEKVSLKHGFSLDKELNINLGSIIVFKRNL